MNYEGDSMTVAGRDVRSGGHTERVRVFATNYNCKAAVELCIRSARRYAGYPFELTVGDSGSTDGSRAMLRSFADRGWLTLEEDPTRTTNDWMDHFLATCSERFAVFVHADVEFRRPGWLRELVDAAVTRDRVMVYAEMVPEVAGYIEPHIHLPQLDTVTGPWGGTAVRLVERPACWLLLADVSRARQVRQTFQDLRIETDEVPEGRLTYATGGAFFKEMKEMGLPWELMHPSFRSSYWHYGSLSWLRHVDRQSMPWRFRLSKRRDRWTIVARLQLARLRDQIRPLEPRRAR